MLAGMHSYYIHALCPVLAPIIKTREFLLGKCLGKKWARYLRMYILTRYCCQTDDLQACFHHGTMSVIKIIPRSWLSLKIQM